MRFIRGLSLRINRDVLSIDLNFFLRGITRSFLGRWRSLKSWEVTETANEGDRIEEIEEGNRRELGRLNPSAPRRSSYLPQGDARILYAGVEAWGYSAGCKLMVSPWHGGVRPKGSG